VYCNLIARRKGIIYLDGGHRRASVQQRKSQNAVEVVDDTSSVSKRSLIIIIHNVRPQPFHCRTPRPPNLLLAIAESLEPVPRMLDMIALSKTEADKLASLRSLKLLAELP